jgi:structural maintenance of chromosomes protein 5
LPQDKVAEFAALSPVELLLHTQRAVAEPEMVEYHKKLSLIRKKEKEDQYSQSQQLEQLRSLEQRQQNQQQDVDRLREREDIIERVRMLEHCRPLAKYRDLQRRHKESNVRKRAAKEELSQLQNDLGPSLEAVNDKQKYKEEVEAAFQGRRRLLERGETKADDLEKDLEDLKQEEQESIVQIKKEQELYRTKRSDAARLRQVIDNMSRQIEQQKPVEFSSEDFNIQIVSKPIYHTADSPAYFQ